MVLIYGAIVKDVHDSCLSNFKDPINN